MNGKEIEIGHRPFSEDWWRFFLSASDNMNQSLIVRDVLAGAVVEKLYNEIRGIIRNSSVTNNFRVYINGVQASNDRIITNLPLEEEDMDRWRNRVFGEEKFSIIINQCEQLSVHLSAYLGTCVEHLRDLAGIPLLGYNLTIFMGNYGFTPLGVHHDGTGNNVLHFHVGPGDKVMYNWDEQLYTPEVAALPLDKQLALAEEFRFSAGDLYFMPWNKYHIGNTEDFSIGFTLWFNNPTRASYMKKLTDDVLVGLIDDGETVIQPLTGNTGSRESAFFEAACQLKDGAQTRGFDSLLFDEHRRTMARLSSSGYWNSKSRINEDLALTKEDVSREIQVIEPYRIVYFRREDNLYIYGRGHEQVFDFCDALVGAINKINDDTARYRVGEFIRDLADSLSQRQAFILLSDWYRKQIIALR